MKKNTFAPAQKKTASIVTLQVSSQRRRVITVKTFEQAKKNFEADLDKLYWNYFSSETKDIFQAIDLCKVMRNYADREKRECEKLFANELTIKDIENPEIKLTKRQLKRVYKNELKYNPFFREQITKPMNEKQVA